MDAELVGVGLHRFTSMRRLRLSVTEAWYSRRLLTAEERVAMLLNPAMFRWVQQPDAVHDQGLTRNGMFFLGSIDEFEGMIEAEDVEEDLWLGYAVDEEREEKNVGISKADKIARRDLPDRTELALTRYEVKGKMRMRRRTTLPCDEEFFARAGFHIPHPDLMVFEYRLYPLIPTNNRDAIIAYMEAHEEWLRLAQGEDAVPLPLGPVHPPGIFQPLEYEEALAAEAAE